MNLEIVLADWVEFINAFSYSADWAEFLQQAELCLEMVSSDWAEFRNVSADWAELRNDFISKLRDCLLGRGKHWFVQKAKSCQFIDDVICSLVLHSTYFICTYVGYVHYLLISCHDLFLIPGMFLLNGLSFSLFFVTLIYVIFVLCKFVPCKL